MPLNFKARLRQNILLATAESVHEHLHEFEHVSNSRTNAMVTYMLGDIEGQLIAHLHLMDFKEPYYKKISSMFEEIIDFIPEFNSENIHILTRTFHYLNYKFNNALKEEKQNTHYHAFEPTVLIKALASNKFKDNERSILITRLLTTELEAKTIGLKSDSIYHRVLLKLSDDLFDGMPLKDKHSLLVEFVKSDASNPVNTWTIRNLGYLANIVFKENARELGKELFINTLCTLSGDGEKPTWIIDNNGRLIRPPNNSDYNNVRYIQSETGHHKGFLGLIEKLRNYMCNSIDNYSKMKNTAEVLGCLNDKNYWNSVLDTQTESKLETAVPTVEF